ncbi:MAG: Asp/Glu racemase, partial [Polaromonas sp.]|nr:Asp/Glu racemase [Polaromonas sp.]
MKHLLILNPNTSESVSRLLRVHGQAAAGPQVRVSVRTAALGAPYIACEASYAVAAYAALASWADAVQVQASQPFHAVLIGCFGDPGLFALRDHSGVPTTGLAEAALLEARRHGRFAIVTGGAKWQPMLERLVHNLGLADGLAGIDTVAPSGAMLAQDPDAAHALLAQACLQAVARYGVQAVILGGAGLAGMAAVIQPMVPVPVIDSVQAGVRHALVLAENVPPAAVWAGFDFAWHRVEPALAAMGRPGAVAG